MDALDLKIVRTMGIRPYGGRPQDPEVFKPSYIAKHVGIEPETVKARLARMEEAGFIRFYQLFPNFNHLGINASAHLFKVADDDKKVRAIQKAELIDGLVEIHNFIGSEMCVDVSYRTSRDLGKKLRLLREFTGDMTPLCFYERHMPQVGRELTPLDWRILKAFRYKAKHPIAEIADEVGVSARTVRRHYGRMAQEGSFFLTLATDPGKALGVILYELLFYTTPDSDPSIVQRILDLYDDRYVYHFVPASAALGNFDLLLFAESTGEIEEMRQQGRDIPGVAKVESLVFSSWEEYTDWIDAAIEERIKTE